MSDAKVSDLAAGGAVQDTDEFYAERAGSQVSILGSALGGSQPIILSSTTLSAAQLLALNTTAVELLPAPGGRFYYLIHDFVLHYRFGTTPYNEGGGAIGFGFSIGWGSTVAEIYSGDGIYLTPLGQGAAGSPIAPGDLFQQTEDAYVVPPLTSAQIVGYAWLASQIEDKPISVGMGGTSLTGGDGTLTIRLYYSLIDGAP